MRKRSCGSGGKKEEEIWSCKINWCRIIRLWFHLWWGHFPSIGFSTVRRVPKESAHCCDLCCYIVVTYATREKRPACSPTWLLESRFCKKVNWMDNAFSSLHQTIDFGPRQHVVWSSWFFVTFPHFGTSMDEGTRLSTKQNCIVFPRRIKVGPIYQTYEQRRRRCGYVTNAK